MATQIVRRKRSGFAHALTQIVGRGPVHVIILLICFIWLIPSVGLFVSSFRPANLISTTGWWHAFTPPIKFTIQNYVQVLSKANMGRSFFNSLLISIPATVLYSHAPIDP